MEAYPERIAELCERMREIDLDGCLIVQNVDIFYFTGSMQEGWLFVSSSGEARFYVRRSEVRARQESAVEVAVLASMRRFGEQLAQDFPKLVGSGALLKLGIEYDVAPIRLLHRLQGALPQAEWADIADTVRAIRMVKNSAEIAKLRAAAQLANQALNETLSEMRPGMTEIEWLSRFEFAIRRQGHMGLMRMRGFNQELVTGMVGSGWAAAQPTYFDGPAGGQGLGPASPQGAGWKPFRRNEPILVDIGCCVEGYVTDQTRTVVLGDLEPDLMSAYQTAEDILHATELLLKPGTVCEELYLQALAMAEKAGLSEHFMGFGSDQARFLGHGIGLEVDEWPVLAKGFKQPLRPGMVLAIEPKFTFPDRGVVGIENTYLVTEHGFDKLTLTEEGVFRLDRA